MEERWQRRLICDRPLWGTLARHTEKLRAKTPAALSLASPENRTRRERRVPRDLFASVPFLQRLCAAGIDGDCLALGQSAYMQISRLSIDLWSRVIWLGERCRAASIHWGSAKNFGMPNKNACFGLECKIDVSVRARPD